MRSSKDAIGNDDLSGNDHHEEYLCEIRTYPGSLTERMYMKRKQVIK